jgi:hypothetical protein
MSPGAGDLGPWRARNDLLLIAASCRQPATDIRGMPRIYRRHSERTAEVLPANTMLARLIGLTAITAIVGCGNSQPPPSYLGGPAVDPQVRAASKQTLASRVLGAIALERVTGRKADPSRLNQLK